MTNNFIKKNSSINEKPISKPLRAAGVFTLLSFLPSLLNVFLLPLYFNYLDASQFGILALLNIFGGIYSIIANLQLNSSVSVLYFNYSGDSVLKHNYVSVTFSSSLWISIAMLFLFSLTGNLWFRYIIGLEIDFYPMGLMVLITSFSNQIISTFLKFSKNEYRLKEYFFYSIALIALSTSFQVFFIVIMKWDLFGSLLGSLIGNLMVAIILLIVNRSLITLKIDWRVLNESLRFSLPLIPFIALNWLMTVVDKIVLGRYCDTSVVGQYSVLISLLLFANQIFIALWNAFTPKILLSLADNSDNLSLSKIFVRWHIFLGVIILSGTVLVGSNLNLITSNEKYLATIHLFSIGVLAMLPKLLKSISTLQLMYIKKTRALAINNLLTFVTLISGLIILVPLLNMLGAILALAISNSLGFGILYYQSEKKYDIRLKLCRSDVFFLASSILLVAITYWITKELNFTLQLYGLIQFIVLLVFVFFRYGTFMRNTFYKIIRW